MKIPRNQTFSIAATATTFPSRSETLTTTLIYGGVAVAVIIAMTYFCNILLQRIKDLLDDDDKD